MPQRINWPIVISILVVLVVLGVLTQQALFTRFAESRVFSLSDIMPETNADAYTFAVQDAQQRSGLFTQVVVNLVEYRYQCQAIGTTENGGCERMQQSLWITTCNLICTLFQSSDFNNGFSFSYFFSYDDPSMNNVSFTNPGRHLPERAVDELALQTTNTQQNFSQLLTRFLEDCPASADDTSPVELNVMLLRAGLTQEVVWRVRDMNSACTAQFSLPDHDLNP